MKTKVGLIGLMVFSTGLFLISNESHAQVMLGTSPYTQDFNNIGSGLPTGWTVRTGASASALGTAATLVTATTSWNSATGNFRNVAAAAGLTVSSITADQNGAANRALAVHQTGTLGDPGAAFVLHLSNTSGLTNFSLNFKLQSLDGSSSGRTTTWTVDYGFGSLPSSFTAAPTNPAALTTTLSAAGWGSTDVTVNFGTALDNSLSNVWIRIVTLTATTGSSGRPTSAIDDFQLSYSASDVTPPIFTSTYPRISNLATSGFDLVSHLNEAGKTYFVVLADGSTAPSPGQVKSGQDASGIPVPGGFFGAIDVSVAATEYSSSVSGLNPNTDYDVYVVAEDNIPNLQSACVKLDVKTNAFGDQAITFAPLAAKTYGDDPFNLAATSSSGLEISFTSSDPSVASVIANAVTILKAGTVNIVARQGGNIDYHPAADVVQTLIINKADQTIMFDELSSKTFGDASFSLTAAPSSGLAVSFTSSDPLVASIEVNMVTILRAGTVNITASQAGDANHNPSMGVVWPLTINKADQTISFSAIPAITFGSSPFGLGASSSSGLTVSYVSSDNSVATTDGPTVRTTGAGTTTITASQAGDGNYNPAADAAQVLIVNKASQTITFGPIADKKVGDPTFSLSATASSALAAGYSTTSEKISISGNQVTIVNAGRVSITASQAGNANFSAANSVDQSFCINPAKPTVTISNANTETPILTSSATAGNQWYVNGTIIAGATNTTFPVTSAGVYNVQAKVDDCVSVFSSDTPIIFTGDLTAGAGQVVVFPNPAVDYLEVRGINSDVSSSLIFDMLGRMSSITLEKNGEAHRGSVEHLSQGVYLLRVTEGPVVHQIKFIKK